MRKRLLIVLALAMASGLASSQAAPPRPAWGANVTIAVVKDGPSPGTDIVPMIRLELEALLADGENVTFKDGSELDAGWNPTRLERVLAEVLADPDVDIVLLPGALIGAAAVKTELTKPVVSAFPQRADLYGVFDQQNDRSLKDNLSFTLIPQRTLTDLETFRGMISGKVIHFAVAEEYLDLLEILRHEIEQLERALDVELRAVPVTADVDGTLATLGDDIQGILLARTPRLDDNARRRFIEGLNERGIRTFSHEGHTDVEAGALAGRTPEFSTFLARRVALSLHEIIRGVSPNELPVMLPVDARLLVNGRTARQIGYAPGRGLLVSAEFLYPEAMLAAEKPLTLSEAFATAEANNPSLKISTQDIETAARTQGVSRSGLYPQLFGTAGAETVKIPGLEGIIPDSTASAGVRLSQMIYDDRKVADYKSAGRVVNSTREVREVDRLNLLGETGQAYFRYALERALFRVERDNLQLTRENLGLAEVRVEAGYSGRDEVYRWESQVAKRESELLIREADVEAARVALNQVLGIDQYLRWAPEEREIDPEVFPLADGGLDAFLDDLAAMGRMRDAMVAIALENAPEMKAIDESTAALDIQYQQRKRTWYVPVFSLSGIWNYQFYRSPDLSDVDNDYYTVGVYATYPLYIGGARKQEVRRVESELTRRTQESELARQLIERRARTALQRVASSFPVIRLSRTAAESARKNFVVVQDKYTQGLVNVTDLLEAQNETFVTDQAASASVHVFLQDLVELQRAISWFEDEKTSQERMEFVLRVEQAANESSGGYTATGRE